MTFSTMTIIIKGLFVITSKYVTHHNNTAECRGLFNFVLNVIILSVVMLSVNYAEYHFARLKKLFILFFHF
jgi:hypothetical protein